MDNNNLKQSLIGKKLNDSHRVKVKSGRIVKFPKCIINRNNKLSQDNSLINNINSSNISNISKISINKVNKKLNILNTSRKGANLSEIDPNNNNVDKLKDNLLKTKELYNEQNKELFKLRLKYNKLFQYHEANLKTLQSIINRSGVHANLNNLNHEEIDKITKTYDFSHVLNSEERKQLKEKHLITCFKTKILEYKYLIDKKDEEISKMKNSSRMTELCKLKNDNASKSLENINLSREKQLLHERIMNIKSVMGSLSTRCQWLEKSENKNISSISELQIRLRDLSEENNLKDKKIEKLTKEINKSKEEQRLMELKIKRLKKEIDDFREDKEKCENFMKEKEKCEKYEMDIENLRKKVESLKNENEKLNECINNMKKENMDILNKYNALEKENEKYMLNKDNIKNKIKENEKQIKSLDEQMVMTVNKKGEIEKKIERWKKGDNNTYNFENEDFKQFENLINKSKENYLEEIGILKQKIIKLEEKNNFFNRFL